MATSLAKIAVTALPRRQRPRHSAGSNWLIDWVIV
jgi:hypothetical protein